jgi:uncharacterized protein YecT (DUF1311 family)
MKILNTILRLSLPTLLFILPSAAHSASFDCSKAATRVERMICGDPDLCYLDEQLDKAYARMRMFDVAGHVEEQRRWLKEVRNACETTSCMHNAYATRIGEVLRQAVNSPKANMQGPMTLMKQLSICTEIAGLAEDELLTELFLEPRKATEEEREAYAAGGLRQYHGFSPPSIYDVPLGNGSTEQFYLASTGGTCPAQQMYSIDAVRQSNGTDTGRDEHHDINVLDSIRWAYFGGGDNYVLYRGDPLFVASDYRSKNAAELINYLNKGRIQPLCQIQARHFDPQNRPKESVYSADHEVCEAALNGTAKRLLWKTADVTANWNEEEKKLMERRRLRRAEDSELLSADIDADGNEETVARLTYHSGAGCGARHRLMLVVDPETLRPGKHPFNDELFNDAEVSPDVEFIDLNGKTYIYSPSERQTHYTKREALYSYWNDDIKLWCTFKRRAQYLVEPIEFMKTP